MGLSELAWTTREEVAATLLAYLQQTRPPADGEPPRPIYPTRERVAELLSSVAGPAVGGDSLARALDAEEEPEVRQEALQGFLQREIPLSAADLRRLLRDPVLVAEDDPCFEVADLLRLARTPEAEAAGRAYLLSLDPVRRAGILSALLPDRVRHGSVSTVPVFSHAPT